MEKYVIDYLKLSNITYTSLFFRGLKLKVKDKVKGLNLIISILIEEQF